MAGAESLEARDISPRGAQHAAIPASVLFVGAIALVTLGVTRKSLPEILLAIGVTFSLAWTVERGHRFAGSGFVLFGLGLSLTLADYLSLGGYRDELIFTGVACGLLALRYVAPDALAGGAAALLSVASFEAALTYFPRIVAAPQVYRAFDDGWAFGVLVGIMAIWIILRPSHGQQLD